MPNLKIISFILCILTIVTCEKIKVAVYEHVLISPENPEGNFTREEAFHWMLKNLEVFGQKAREASEQGSKVIVFPEYGVTGFDHTRDSIVPFLEDIPDPSANWIPAVFPDKFQNTRVLQYLSRTARENDIFLVANMGDIKKCDDNKDPICPKDGRYQFNTNVVFDNKGKLISRYHKYNLYDEMPLFDPAPKIEYANFETPFGSFGTVICFDLLHYEPTQSLIEKFNVKNLLVTSAWNVFYPFIIPIQMYAGLAKRNNINVIASNARHKIYNMASSGIFGPGVEISSSTDVANPSGELLINKIETDIQTIAQITDDRVHYRSRNYVQRHVNETYNGSYSIGMDMTFATLSNDSDTAFVCTDTVCCALDYTFKILEENELFILSASDFYMTKPGEVHLQVCAVHRCPSPDTSTCGGLVTGSTSVFSHIRLQGYFDTSLVFPFVSSSPYGNNSYSLEMDNYRFDKDRAIIESDSLDHPLLSLLLSNTVFTDDVRDAEATRSHGAILVPCVILTSLQLEFISILLVLRS